MRFLRTLLVVCLFPFSTVAHAESITIAAASDLKFALDEIVRSFKRAEPKDQVEITYGSSGKIHTQIQQGAPYDLFFSADISYPRELAKGGLAASEVKPYAIGRIVLWSATRDASKMTLRDLADPSITRIAIANPKHAPYGKRAEEALRSSGLWDQIQSKLVFGENIAQTAQFVQTGNAQIGLIALSLAFNPELSAQGGFWLIPDTLHEPLEQGYIITQRAANNALAWRFSAFLESKPARELMKKYGFTLPGENRKSRSTDVPR